MARARHEFAVVNDRGDLQPGATVEVRKESDGLIAAIFSDRAGASPMANPFTTLDGNVAYHVAGGAYKVTATFGPYTKEFRYVAVGTLGEADNDNMPTTFYPSPSQIIMGHTANIAALSNNTDPAFQTHGTDASRSSMVGTRWANSAATGANFLLNKSRGAAVGTRGVVQSGDQLGTFGFGGDDGANFILAAAIRGLVGAAAGTNDMPGVLQFLTTPDASATLTERYRIDQAGEHQYTMGGTAVGRFGATSNYNVYSLNNSKALNGSLGIFGGASGDANRLYLSSPADVVAYIAGVEYHRMTAGPFRARVDLATPAAASSVPGITLGSALIGFYWGTGNPGFTAPKGSIYIKTDGGGTADRLWVNTNAGTTWTNFVTAA